MTFRYERTGSERKALVKAVSEHTEYKAIYLGAPGFMYQIGDYTISVDGTLDTGDADSVDIHSLLVALEECGFVPVEDEEQLVAGESNAISINLPAEDFTDSAFDNLQKLIAGKATLVRMAIGDALAEGAEALPVKRDGDMIQFPWFRYGTNSKVIEAWSLFASALCEAAKKQSRVTLKERVMDADSSPRFLLRCFLLKLGFIGDATKEARRIILSGMPGNGSRKTPKAAVVPSVPIARTQEMPTA